MGVPKSYGGVGWGVVFSGPWVGSQNAKMSTWDIWFFARVGGWDLPFVGMYDVSPMRIFRQPKDAKKRKGGLFQRHMSGGGAGGDSNAAAAADANISSSPQHSKMGVVITSSRQAHRRYGELCWFFFSFVYCLLCRVQIWR